MRRCITPHVILIIIIIFKFAADETFMIIINLKKRIQDQHLKKETLLLIKDAL